MIPKNDLRLDNLVMYDNRYFKIDAISSELPFLNTIEFGVGVVDYNNITPIPLTPEILEKCGFKKENEWAVLKFPVRMGIRFYNFNSAECDIIQDDKYIAFKNSHIQYLHQLQNLIYCLTNQELEINL